jgi:glycosyltransferase involved in cell wall biosynthesis
MRIAAFGFRSIPMRPGCAGADKFASELLPRLVAQGHQVTGYNRLYPGEQPLASEVGGVQLKHFKTISRKGFDTLLHSFKATVDIIRNDVADVIHIQNGGNSIFGLVLRLFGKKVFISQDGVDWKRDKWPWYGKLYLYLSAYLTAHGPSQVIFDNVFIKQEFERRFGKQFEFIPFGSEVEAGNGDDAQTLAEFGLEAGEYFLFVGRFIPDKGLQYLVPAFEKVATNKKLVLVGGSPNPSPFEAQIKGTQDPRIVFTGFLYGNKTHALMRNAYAYIQPSDVEGLSPVILENMGLGTPVICSDIKENQFVVGEHAVLFVKGSIPDCQAKLEYALGSPERLRSNAVNARARAEALFSWDAVTTAHVEVFNGRASGYAESLPG